MVRVDRVTRVEGYRLRVGFSDGTERVIDAEPFLRGPIFQRVRNDRASRNTYAQENLEFLAVF